MITIRKGATAGAEPEAKQETKKGGLTPEQEREVALIMLNRQMEDHERDLQKKVLAAQERAVAAASAGDDATAVEEWNFKMELEEQLKQIRSEKFESEIASSHVRTAQLQKARVEITRANTEALRAALGDTDTGSISDAHEDYQQARHELAEQQAEIRRIRTAESNARTRAAEAEAVGAAVPKPLPEGLQKIMQRRLDISLVTNNAPAVLPLWKQKLRAAEAADARAAAAAQASKN